MTKSRVGSRTSLSLLRTIKWAQTTPRDPSIWNLNDFLSSSKKTHKNIYIAYRYRLMGKTRTLFQVKFYVLSLIVCICERGEETSKNVVTRSHWYQSHLFIFYSVSSERNFYCFLVVAWLYGKFWIHQKKYSNTPRRAVYTDNL